MLATSLESNLPRVVIVEDMDSSSLTRGPLVRVYSFQVGPSWMDPIVIFWSKDYCPRTKVRQRRCVEVLIAIGYLKNRSCTSALTQDHIYCACIQRQWSPCWKSYMKAYVGVTHRVGLWCIEPLPRDTGVRACTKPPKIMRKSVTNVKDMPQILISQGKS